MSDEEVPPTMPPVPPEENVILISEKDEEDPDVLMLRSLDEGQSAVSAIDPRAKEALTLVKEGPKTAMVVSNEAAPLPVVVNSVPDVYTSTPPPASCNVSVVEVIGMRVEEHSKGVALEGDVWSLQADTPATLRLFGKGFTESAEIVFTAEAADRGDRCTVETTAAFPVRASVTVLRTEFFFSSFFGT